MKIEYRTATLTKTASDGALHTIEALAVPYGEEFMEIAPGMFERFTPGSITTGVYDPKLCYEHNQTIGRVTSLDQDDDGLHIHAALSDTTLGRDVSAMIADGTLSKLSIGFIPDATTMTVTSDENGNTFITHNTATLLEVSIVAFPAYPTTSINEFRSFNGKETPMTSTTTTSQVSLDSLGNHVAELASLLDDQTRKLATIEQNITSTPPVSPLATYRNAGEYMKAYSADTTGQIRALAETAISTSDTAGRPGWFDRELALMAAKQPVTNAFTHLHSLPSEGMSFDYPLIEANTLNVAQQPKEGDTLVTGKLTLTQGNVPVNTFGGYTLITRQTIDRASAQYLSTVHSALNIQYANAIEAKTQATLKTVLDANKKTTTISSTLNALEVTVDEIIGLTLDIVDYYENELIYPLTGIGVSPDVFRTLTTLKEDAKAFAFAGSPADKIGTLSIRTPGGDTTELTVTRFPVAATGEKLVFGYSQAAIEVNEAPNAPLRLDDQRENTNLTNVFSVYGYATHATVAPAAIVPVKFADTVVAEG